MLRTYSECSKTWKKLKTWKWPPPPPLTSYLDADHDHMFSPYWKQKNFEKKLIIFREGGVGAEGGTPFAENSAKIINLIFEPFPNCLTTHVFIIHYFL